MNEQVLVEELLARGLTEQQIIDLVAREVIKNRTAMRESPIDPSSESSLGVASSTGVEPIVQPPALDVVDLAGKVLTPNTTEVLVRQHEAVVLSRLFEQFTGPLPPPSLCRDYEALVPGFTERNLRMHEKNQETAHASVLANDRRLDRGQLYALVFCVLALVTSVVFALLGFSGTGATIAIAVIVPVVSAFLYRQHVTSKQLDALREGQAEEEHEEHGQQPEAREVGRGNDRPN